MKICITSQGKTLDSQVDPRFGRCSYLIVLDTDTMQFETIENIFADASGGAGIQTGQLMVEKGVKAVLTGNVGPNAYQTLKAAGIIIYTGLSGTVSEAVGKLKNNELESKDKPSVNSHFGMNK
ncbi:MAG: dinitrogenase iron-molybdenum cofactor biosynthesis protein [Elusimicrobia bacterium RIFOXYC2_FULL_34_12]|nr:MAG: dinitrogenase iron-molybdenum cofactor biosynthesis protein [Elusimicrobia bacterium RIFOXYC2_FULL_34_12]HAM38295.1 dinitrogenase iron-molybdenum cofactor biosynthesis protein [Elusimicrobiota bacterium]